MCDSFYYKTFCWGILELPHPDNKNVLPCYSNTHKSFLNLNFSYLHLSNVTNVTNIL